MKTLLLLLSFILSLQYAIAQSIGTSSPFEFHRFYLKEPAQELLELKYEDTCEPADGKLLPGGQSVLIRNYKPHQRLYVRLLNAQGSIKEVIQTPCYIDPVVGEL
ncbi:MAG: hypothetical protein JNL47_06010 [Bacteroidia bacterium]|nr:hypothetical protein [Bacteroidia bacterium]